MAHGRLKKWSAPDGYRKLEIRSIHAGHFDSDSRWSAGFNYGDVLIVKSANDKQTLLVKRRVVKSILTRPPHPSSSLRYSESFTFVEDGMLGS